MECFGITILSVTPTQGPLILSVGMSVSINSPPTGTVHLKYFPGEECFWPKDHRFVHFSLRLRLTIPLPYTLGRMGVHLAPCSSLLDDSVVFLQNVGKLKKNGPGAVFEERIGKHSVVFMLRAARPWRDSAYWDAVSTARPSIPPSISANSLDDEAEKEPSEDQEEETPIEDELRSRALSPRSAHSMGSHGSSLRLARPRKTYKQRSRVHALKTLNSDPSMGWAPSQASNFSLRVGPNYMKNGAKSQSPPALYDVVFCDVVRCPQHIPHCVNRMLPPPKTFLGEATHAHWIPPYIVSNTSFPLAGPLDWFSNDESTSSIIIIGRLSEEARKLPEDDPGLVLWKRYLKAGNEERTESSSSSLLLKIIAKGENIEDLNIPSWAVPHISRYNGKPILMQKETLIRSEDDWVEISTNVAKVNPVSRTVLSRLKEQFKTAKVNIGYTIQGVEDDELPERLLFAIRFQNLDFEGAEALAT